MIREIPIGEVWWGPSPNWPDFRPGEIEKHAEAQFRYKAGEFSDGITSWVAWDSTTGEWRRITKAEFEHHMVEQLEAPVLLNWFDGKRYWLYKNRVYSSDPGLNPQDAKASISFKKLSHKA